MAMGRMGFHGLFCLLMMIVGSVCDELDDILIDDKPLIQREDYHDVKSLGEGGFAAVREVDVPESVHGVRRGKYALKKANFTIGRRFRPDVREMAADEARFLKTLKGARNVVTLYHTWQDDNGGHRYFLLKRYGKNLRTHLYPNGPDGKARRISLKTALKFLKDIATGLQSVHSAGIVHLDLKAANICLERRKKKWVCVIIDFGIAKRVGVHLPKKRRKNQGSYTNPPELTDATKYSDATKFSTANDIWFFGQICLELLECASGIPRPRYNDTKSFESRVEALQVPWYWKDFTKSLLQEDERKRPNIDTVLKELRSDFRWRRTKTYMCWAAGAAGLGALWYFRDNISDALGLL